MALDWDGLLDEFRDVISQVWPDVVKADGGRKIFEAEHVEEIPFEDIAQTHGLPYAVIDLDPEPFVMGLANRCYAAEVTFLYLAQTEQGAKEIRPLMETMAAYLAGATLANGKVWDDPDPLPMWGRNVIENETLKAKKLPLLAGAVVFTVLLTETK